MKIVIKMNNINVNEKLAEKYLNNTCRWRGGQLEGYVCFLSAKFVENKHRKRNENFLNVRKHVESLSYVAVLEMKKTFHHYRVCVKQLDWQP